MKKILLILGFSLSVFSASAQYSFSGSGLFSPTSYTTVTPGGVGFPTVARTSFSGGGSAVTTFTPASLPGISATATTTFSSGTTYYSTFRPAPLSGYPATITTIRR